jgi:hypothetical protein
MEEDWDEGVAQELVHAYVLVGVTMLNPDRSVMLRLQVHGQVIAADPVNGIEIRLSGSRAGGSYRLPPNTGVFRAAAPGLYWLAETGEEVADPDYLATWTIRQPARH